MDKKYFIEKLEQRSVDLDKSRDFWNHRAREFYKFSRESQKDSTIDFLNEFMDLKDKTVLDIGFGAGRYLKLLSNEGAKVSGIELSDEMVSYAKTHCEESGIDTREMELYNMPWEEVDLDKLNWRNKFDLVFVSKNPALNSYESIKKMISASKKGVFFSTHMIMEEDVLRELYREIHGDEYKTKKDSLWYIFNILYLDGYYPNVKIEDKSSKMELSTEDVYYRYAHRLFPDGASKEDENKLKELIYKYEVDGKVHINMDRKSALIYFEK